MIMSLKAKLRIVLHADETVVAESDNSALWQKVLIAINSSSSAMEPGELAPPNRSMAPAHHIAQEGADPIDRLAKELGLSRAEIEGACSPSTQEPYLHLDLHCWEAMKKQTPERGPTAYSSMAVSATLLALWFRSAGLGNPTQAQAQAVLKTIDIRDQNPGRGIERSEWLQSRPGGAIVINPAKVSRAIALARAFCSQKWTKDSE
jgi:hypothetical protein